MTPRLVFLFLVVPLFFLSGIAEGGEKRSEPKNSTHTDRYGDPLPQEAVARLGSIRLRQEDRIGALAFSPDGKILASGGEPFRLWGSRIYLWDAVTGRQIRVFKEEKARGVSSLLFSPDGKTLVSVGDYHALFYGGSHGGGEEIPYSKIHLWDVASGKHRLTLTGHNSFVTSVAFAPNGKLLASVSADDTIRLWNPNTGKPIRVIQQSVRDSFRNYFKVYFTPDGKMLVTGGGDNTIRLWDVVTGKQIRIIKAGGEGFNIHLSPDGKIAASSSVLGSEGKVRLWDLASGKQVGECPEPGTSGFWRFGPDSESLILGVYDQRRHDTPMYLWNWKKGQRIREFEGRPIYVTSTALSMGEQTLAVADRESIRLWNVATGKESSLVASHRKTIHSVAVSPDGRTVISGSDDRTIRLWELLSGKPLHVWDGRQGQVGPVVFSPDGKLAASGGSKVVRTWDVHSGKNLATFTGSDGDSFLKLAFSSDGKTLVGGSWGGKVYRWDVKSGKEHRRLHVHGKAGVYPSAFFLGIRQLACISNDGADLYDLDSGARVSRFNDSEVVFLEGSLNAAAFSPDGNLLATANRNKEIYLREVINNQVIESVFSSVQGPDFELPPSHTRPLMSSISGLAFSPDGQFVAAGYENGKVIFWDLLHGKDLHIFRGHAGRIPTITFTPDGKYLITGSQDGTALVWKVPDSIRHLQREEKVLKDAELRALDIDLAGRDTRKAYLAIETLTSAPAETVPLLRRRLRPVPVIDATGVPQLIEDLDSDRFAVREAAMRDLSALGVRAGAKLRSTLASKPTLEARRRIEELLQTITLDMLYASRAILVLERIGTPDAQQILKDLMQGDAAAWQTQAARAALERIARR